MGQTMTAALEWDYSDLAAAYGKRPGYADAAIDRMLAAAGLRAGASACDVGAGVGHLTVRLVDRGLRVAAVEPNEEMRERGRARTAGWPGVGWSAGTGEATGQPDRAFDLVTFGSSFNVTDRGRALAETARILKPGGWFACMWNHRDLDDPIQSSIEHTIRERLPEYDYGSRREDQTAVIAACGLFDEAERIEAPVRHTQSIADCVEAWRSHATLQRQAGTAFGGIVDAIASLLAATGKGEIVVPYTTRIWLARLRG